MSDEDKYAQQEGESYDDYLVRISQQFLKDSERTDEEYAYEAISTLYRGLTVKAGFPQTQALYVIGVYLATVAVQMGE